MEFAYARRAAIGAVDEDIVALPVGNVFVRHLRRQHRDCERILCVNGAVGTLESNRWAEAAFKDFEIISFDLPAFGRSRAHNEHLRRASLDSEVELLLALIDRFEPHHLFSSSWGGLSAIVALAQRPGRLRSAGIASFSIEITPELVEITDTVRTLLAAGRRIDAVEFFLARIGRRLHPRLQASYRADLERLDDQQWDYVLSHVGYIMDLHENGDLLRALKADLIGRIDVPVLFVNGEEDELTPPSAVAGLDHHIPNARLEAIPGAGHFLVHESFDVRRRVVALFHDFIDHSVDGKLATA